MLLLAAGKPSSYLPARPKGRGSEQNWIPLPSWLPACETPSPSMERANPEWDPTYQDSSGAAIPKHPPFQGPNAFVARSGA
jgi:hypothetical protein